MFFCFLGVLFFLFLRGVVFPFCFFWVVGVYKFFVFVNGLGLQGCTFCS